MAFEDAVSHLREFVFENVWPRHQAMHAAIADALASTDTASRKESSGG